MKTYIVNWTTNYGLSVMIINEYSLEAATKLAKENGAWSPFEIVELDIKTEGIVFREET